MKRFLYKKWNFLVLWNRFVLNGRLSFNRKVFFIQFDMCCFHFWDYNKWMRYLALKKLYVKIELLLKTKQNCV